ncbi:MAG: HD domain-containing protein [Acidobacteriia bacterium]|nr:HD domain-containing protein [Terriglobia bacterium]
MAATILFVSADPFYRGAWEALLSGQGYKLFTAATIEAALLACPVFLPDLVVLHMVSAVSGFEACRLLKADSRNRLMPVVLMMEASGAADFSRAREAGASEIWARFRTREELLLRVRSTLELQSGLDRQAAEVIASVARDVEARDPYARGRSERLSNNAARFGKSLGLRKDVLETLRMATLLHDIGNIAIPDAILFKSGPLSRQEIRVVERHPADGERICAPLRAFRDVLPVIRHHHERMDGSGYPDGLKGGQIPPIARIFQVVDICDALTSDRPQRRGVSLPSAMTILYEEVEMGWLDADLVTQFALLMVGADHAMALARSCRQLAVAPRKWGRGL